MRELLTDYTVRTILLGSAILGIVSGVLGVYAVLKKQSLLGDAVSHAALPGICLAFLLTGRKTPIILFIGAFIAGWIGTLLVLLIVNNTKIKSDSALGIILSVFFGIGMTILSFIQKQDNANQAGLDKFLFGQASTLMKEDVITMGVISFLALLVVFIFWKEFKLLSFDPQYGKTLGFNMKALDILITTIIVIAIVLGLQTVGVVLMSAMLLSPAAAARQWTDKLSVLVILSGIFGAISGIIGTIISSLGANVSTGPVIILVSITIVIFSFIFAPKRGLLFNFIKQKVNKKQLQTDRILFNMYDIARKHKNPSRPHSLSILKNISSYNKNGIKALENEGLIEMINDPSWTLTEKGIKKIKEHELMKEED